MTWPLAKAVVRYANNKMAGIRDRLRARMLRYLYREYACKASG